MVLLLMALWGGSGVWCWLQVCYRDFPQQGVDVFDLVAFPCVMLAGPIAWIIRWSLR